MNNNMNGAESLARTLLAGDVRVCFANPGTSEMHFVAALDKIQEMRCILGLFEGVVTGAADGYYRMSGLPAATLLHLGPGLANGLANIHNARKAGSGMINVVGEHASYHLELDAPLTTDIAGIAKPLSDWVYTAKDSHSVAGDGAAAVEIAKTAPGKIATLILPADTAWGPAEKFVVPKPTSARAPVRAQNVLAASKSLQDGRPAALLLGGAALRGRLLELAGLIAEKTGCSLLCENLNARMERGAGRVFVERIPYPVDAARSVLQRFERIVLVGAKAPIAFFAYPNKQSILTREDAKISVLGNVADDLEGALESLAVEIGARSSAPAKLVEFNGHTLPHGAPTPAGIAQVLCATIPENAIVIDEAITAGRTFAQQTSGARPHDWLNSMGGSIGFGLPLALGAAVAAPQRKVLALEGDGSAMYTEQALWTMAREQLDVTVLVFANRSYNILHGELANVGAEKPGRRALDMLSLDRPSLDWRALAKGHGVEAGQATDLDGLAKELKRGFDSNGPYLIELVM